MKKKRTLSTICVVCCMLLFVSTNAKAQTPGEWTWMHGNNTPNSAGVFGVQGVANPANTPPSLYEPCEWKDNSGNFWLYGGLRNIITGTQSCALWKYDVATNQWTWVKGSAALNQPAVYGVMGVPAAANTPGSVGYGIPTWVDPSGNLWMMSSSGYNDLWKYNISINQWTWMKGSGSGGGVPSYGTQGVPSPTNLPPGKLETSCTWIDIVGNLWVYGGIANDLWKYDISTNEWTWMQGTNMNMPPVYGTQGVAALVNTPGGRRIAYASWTDISGDLWFFGGAINWVSLNCLWKYNIATNQWTWMKGPNTFSDPGNYGTKCISTNTNVPPARFENRARVRDACGNFWNFGGMLDITSSNVLNDLWHYNVATNQWTWVSGDNIPNQAAVYGTQGISALANKPAGRAGSVAWIDNNGYIYVFGGMDKSNSNYNDLFRYAPPGSFIQSQVNATACNPCNGSATLTFACAMPNYSYVWSNGSSTLNSANTTNTITGLCPGTYTVTATSNCTQSQTATYVITGSPCGGITANVNSASICSGTTPCPTLTATGASGVLPYTYLWSTTATTANINPPCSASAIYTVTITDNTGLTATSTAVVTVNPAVTVTTTPTNISCNGGTNGSATTIVAGGTVQYTYSWSTGNTQSTISNLQPAIYTVTVTDNKGCTSTSTVVIISPPPLVGQFTKGTANCAGCSCKEWIMVTATGGTNPYNYLWSDTYVNRYRNQLCVGAYTINITDKNGCSINVNITVP